MFCSYRRNRFRLIIIHFSASDKWSLCLDTLRTNLPTENTKVSDRSGYNHRIQTTSKERLTDSTVGIQH